MPKGLKEFIVKAAPYLVILGIIVVGLSLLAILPLVLGTSSYMAVAPMMYNAGATTQLWIGLIFSAAVLVLNIMALPGLFKRTHKSWDLIFYGQLLGLVHMLLSMSLVGLVINAIIGFYVLFQVRPYYVGEATISDAPAAPASSTTTTTTTTTTVKETPAQEVPPHNPTA